MGIHSTANLNKTRPATMSFSQMLRKCSLWGEILQLQMAESIYFENCTDVDQTRKATRRYELLLHFSILGIVVNNR